MIHLPRSCMHDACSFFFVMLIHSLHFPAPAGSGFTAASHRPSSGPLDQPLLIPVFGTLLRPESLIDSMTASPSASG